MSGPPTTQYVRPPGRDVLQPDEIAAAQAFFGPPGQHVVGTDGADRLSGAGKDKLKGGPGDDWMTGNMGADLLYGRPGDDSIHGGQDEDLIEGEEGDDTLWGDLEGDSLDGGPGADHMVLGNDTGAGDGHLDHVRFASGQAAGDVVYGFEAQDVLWIDGAIATQAQAEALGLTFLLEVHKMRERRSTVCVAVAVLAALMTMSGPATADKSRRAADAFASAASKQQGMHCGVKPASRTILCIVNADDRVTEQIAGMMVLLARTEDLPLRGWKLSVVNLHDWVVTRDF